MAAYCGYHTCKMFIKGKPIGFSFKIWMLCSSSGYPYVMEIYCGGKNESSGMSLGEDVMTLLLSKIANPSSHEIEFDNFFASYNLLKKLADSRIRTTGSVRSNRIKQNPLLDNNTLAKETTKVTDFRSDGTVFIYRWNDNAVVTVAPNHQTHEPISYTKLYSKSVKKKIDVTQPALIKYYNKEKFMERISIPHLGFLRDITLNLLRSEPKLISQPRPKIHVPTELRKTDNHFLKSASQGSCAVCQKKLPQYVC
ncbi:piggyBac transposable element-derived protein 3 [Nephila pilipes]|uniref:PiggyBac transposable element-derived protein 3 n=1 Tax=Nephila pilipes TaxID=299642 RepID=A0A8X6KFV2_NEPPI|nr:piggyBac transposable element-derived protein 3 [Nephila pilipes]